jgi:hypothetical protein
MATFPASIHKPVLFQISNQISNLPRHSIRLSVL